MEMRQTIIINKVIKSKKPNPFIRELKVNWGLFLLLIPGFLFLLIFIYVPMFGIFIAFKNINYAKGIFGSPWVGFENFNFLFKSVDALLITRNTVLYNLVFIITGLVFSVCIAIALNELRNKALAKIYQNALFLPYFLSWVIVSYIVFSLLNVRYGLLNKSILPLLGMKGINWYSEPKLWIFIIPIVQIWKSIGYGTILYLAGITGIDQTYYEAAVIDGATKWQQITQITIPLLKPLMVITTILAVGRIFSADFGLFFQVTQDSGQLFDTTNVIDTYVYRALTGSGDIGMACAAGLFQSAIGFVLVLLTNLIVTKIDSEYALF